MKKPQGTKDKKKTDEPKVLMRHELTPEQKQEIKDAFDSIDSDRSGYIDIEELKIAMLALGIDTKKDDTSKIIDDMDKNKDGKISCQEFIDLLTLQITDKDHTEEIKKIHANIADDSSQKINFNSLKALCNELGENISDDELKEMIEEADYDKDGEVDENDFFILMKKINVLGN